MAGKKPIWKLAQELAANIPEEEFKRLPSDLAQNYKHYLYGHPKQCQPKSMKPIGCTQTNGCNSEKTCTNTDGNGCQ